VMGQAVGIMLQSAVNRRAAIATVAGGVGVAAAWPGREVHAQTDPAPAPNPVIASWPHVFQHTDFQFQFLLGLGSTYEQAADVGELFAAASQITDGDYDSWYDTFVVLGERVQRIAESSAAAGNSISAREAWLRASGYYGQAYFFTYGTKQPDRIVATWERHRACFDQFAALLQPAAEPVAIPYEHTTLPGYVLRVDATDAPRPWLVMNNGSDGTATDMWAQGAAAGLRRGYNVLIFDGPGQGAALWRQQLYFRPDGKPSSPRSSTGCWSARMSIPTSWSCSASARPATGCLARSPSSSASRPRSPTRG
jgi:hypothetical protein